MRRFTSITAGELRDLLNDLDKDAIVVFASDYGDHIHTQQVHSISGDFKEEAIYESAYSDSGWAIQEDDEVPDEEEVRQQQVIVIK
jgi:hypothetical protein